MSESLTASEVADQAVASYQSHRQFRRQDPLPEDERESLALFVTEAVRKDRATRGPVFGAALAPAVLAIITAVVRGSTDTLYIDAMRRDGEVVLRALRVDGVVLEPSDGDLKLYAEARSWLAQLLAHVAYLEGPVRDAMALGELAQYRAGFAAGLDAVVGEMERLEEVAKVVGGMPPVTALLLADHVRVMKEEL